MKTKPTALILIFSLILNVVFMGIFAAQMLPVFNRDRSAGEPMKPLFLQLDLSAEQRARFKADRDKFKKELREMRQTVGKKQLELIDLLAASSLDEQALNMKQEEIRHLQAAIQDRVINHLLQESSVLNPEQRTRFFRLVKERINSRVQARPPLMRSSERCRPGEGDPREGDNE